MKSVIVILSIVFIWCACQPQEKFDKVKWRDAGDVFTFPYRKNMLSDLLNNYHLQGKKYSEIINLLGEPQSDIDSTYEMVYRIEIDWGTIDPVYFKNLRFHFSHDSVVQKFETYQWKK